MKNSKHKIITGFIASALLLMSTMKADAQKVELGVRFMPTFTAFKVYTPSSGTVAGSVSFGYGIGAIAGFNFTKHIGIQGEIIYNSLSQRYKEADVERKINLRYINIPLLLSINTSKYKMVNVNFVAGPQIGINVGSNIRASKDDGTATVNGVLVVKKGDIGIAYGAGIDFGLNKLRTLRLGIGFRGVYGLIDISDRSKTLVTDSYYLLDRTHVKTYSGYIGLSYLFGKAAI